MKFSNKIVCCMLLLNTAFSFGQNIGKHEWKERVLILLIDEKDNTVYNNQLGQLKSDTKGLKERKLVVYHSTPTTYATGITNLQWKLSTKPYKSYKKTEAPFEIILVGLDGSIKLRQTKLISRKDLYSLIDGMPMRRLELKKQ